MSAERVILVPLFSAVSAGGGLSSGGRSAAAESRQHGGAGAARIGDMAGFRFGVLAESAGSVEQLVATARRAEELGYDTVLLRDHFVPEPFGDQVAPDSPPDALIRR